MAMMAIAIITSSSVNPADSWWVVEDVNNFDMVLVLFPPETTRPHLLGRGILVIEPDIIKKRGKMKTYDIAIIICHM